MKAFSEKDQENSFIKFNNFIIISIEKALKNFEEYIRYCIQNPKSIHVIYLCNSHLIQIFQQFPAEQIL